MRIENIYPWREHLPKVVLEVALLKTKEQRSGEKLPANYRWEHVQAVVRLGIELARLTGADREVVEAAAWLHDVRKEGRNDNHGTKGAKAAREILAATDFPREKVDRVADAIRKHVGLYKDELIEPLEAAVLWDADKLSKLGVGSILHYFIYWMNKGDENVDQLIEHGSTFEWQEKTVKSFNTEPALVAGKKRLDFQRVFWNKLIQELDGFDLE